MLYLFLLYSLLRCGHLATLDLMGEMSQRAKRDGWVVAMAPMESYLDPYTHEFSR